MTEKPVALINPEGAFNHWTSVLQNGDLMYYPELFDLMLDILALKLGPDWARFRSAGLEAGGNRAILTYGARKRLSAPESVTVESWREDGGHDLFRLEKKHLKKGSGYSFFHETFRGRMSHERDVTRKLDICGITEIGNDLWRGFLSSPPYFYVVRSEGLVRGLKPADLQQRLQDWERPALASKN